MKRYKGKHFAEKEKLSIIKVLKLFIAFIVVLGLTFSPIARILSYYTAVDTCVNQFEIEGTYVIHYDANGGTGTMPDQEIFCTMSQRLNTNTFEYTGYEFSGWNTASGGTGTAYTDGQSVSGLAAEGSTITLYAQWVEDRYVAEVVGGQKYETLQQAINAAGTGDTVRVLKNIELTSAVTVGQSKNIILDIQNYTISNYNHGNHNIIKNSGTLEIISGTITSDAGYGAIDNDAHGNLTVSGGQIIATGSRQAIYNAGGNVEVTGTAYLSSSASDRATIQNFKPSNGSAGMITISGGTIVSTATTSKGAIQNEATGTLNVTGGTIISEKAMGIDNSGTLVIGVQDDDIDITDPVIQGKTYGVKTTSNATVEFYDGIIKGQTNAFYDENAITDIEDDCVIQHSSEVISGDTYETAYLEMAGAGVKFNANGGTPAETIEFVPYNTAIGTFPANPTWTNHIFDGLYTDPVGGTQVTTSTVITGPVTFYAHWTSIPVQATFAPGQGGSVSEQTRNLNAGDKLGDGGTLPVPTCPGMYFAGWYTDPTAGVRVDENTVINEDTTYYAHWISDAVAKIGPIHYESVQLAIRDVPTDNTQTTILLLHDYLESAEVIPNQNVLLDLQGYTLYNDGTKKLSSIIGTDARPVVIENSGTLRITNGTVTSSTTQGALNNNGNMIVDGATVTNTGTRQAIYNSGGNLLVTGNSYLSTTSRSERAVIQGYKPNGASSAGTITIDGATIVCDTPASKNRGAVENPATSTLIILDANITSNNLMGVDNKGTLILGDKDGTAGNTTPVIQGKTYGIKSTGTFKFYDGITKGITDSISGTVNDTESGATRVDTSDGTYSITYYQ